MESTWYYYHWYRLRNVKRKRSIAWGMQRPIEVPKERRATWCRSARERELLGRDNEVLTIDKQWSPIQVIPPLKASHDQRCGQTGDVYKPKPNKNGIAEQLVESRGETPKCTQKEHDEASACDNTLIQDHVTSFFVQGLMVLVLSLRLPSREA